MKLVIDLEDKDYENILRLGALILPLEVSHSLKNGILLDEATNGEVLVALFPKAEYEIRPCVVIFSFGGLKRELSIDWWNAPYKGE